MQMFSTKKISQLLTYPFNAEDSIKKILIGSLFVLAGFIIPILPFFFVLGYAAKISKRITEGDGKLTMPDWTDWGTLFKDGARLFGISLVYSLPAFFVFSLGYLLYFVSFFAFSLNETRSLMVVAFLFGMLILFLSIGFGILLMLIESVLLPAALMHAVQKESFGAGFQFKQLWKIFRNNLAGFLITFIFLFGLTYLMYSAVIISIYTFIFAFAAPFISAFLGFYLLLIIFPFMAQAYYEGTDHLETKQEELR